MFKSAFSKYMTAFIIIILLSFLMLSGIITSMIRTYVSDEKEAELLKTSNVIVNSIEKWNVEDLETHVSSAIVSKTVKPLINNDSRLDIIITDAKGKILLTTVGTSEDEDREPKINKDFGTISIDEDYFLIQKDGDEYFYSHRGTLRGVLKKNSMVCVKGIVTDGKIRGYVFAVESASKEPLITITNTLPYVLSLR